MSLRDQFKKAKLLSDKEARRLEHEARIERKEKGREQLEQEQKEREQQVRELQTKEREATRREQAEAEAQRRAREERAAVAAVLADAKKPGPGAVKFYFATASGALPCLELSPREAQELRAGQLCVVRGGPQGTHVYRLLPIELARRVARVEPAAVVFAPRGVVTS